MSNRSTPRQRLIIVTPALAQANNGNWHTAYRWSRWLAKDYRVSLLPSWRGIEDGDADVMIALHARRSAPSIDAWAQQRRDRPDRPLIVVLTGTDLYRDIRSDPDAQRSLDQATRLVVLQEHGPTELPASMRPKCAVIFQSATPLSPAAKSEARLHVVMVGHLRAEKDPLTYLRAARLLRERADIRLEHIGNALDPSLADAARAAASECPNYRWRGGLPRAQARQRIRHSHLLVNASLMEGGAQVVIEAVQSGTAVLASCIGGHVGLLGDDHPGLFAVGDERALCALIERARDEPAFLQRLLDHGRSRAHLYSPERERERLLHLIQQALETPA